MSKWPRILALIVAIWFVIAGLKGVVVGLGALLIYRQVKSELAGSWYAHMALVASIYVSAAALPRLTLGGLYLAWKKFNSWWIAAMCFVDGLFWTFLAAHERAPIGVALAIFVFGALHLAASWIYLHSSVRRRHEDPVPVR